MPRFSELADILVKCRAISESQWEEAASLARDDLPRILAHLAKYAPHWWDGPPPNPPGLTAYQRDIIQSRFDDDELHFLRRDLALNQFLLLEKLGQGGQGEVFRSRQLNPPRFAAVKILTRDTEAARKRFEQEARAMIRIQHPAVARFYLYERIRDGDGDPTDEYLIAMEFVNGTDLQQLIRKIGPIPWKFAIRWICDLLGGLVAIHQSGFIHRDVKPENVMILGPHPGPGVAREDTRAKLLDFGAVDKVGDAVKANGSATRTFVGTVEYASPEQWKGEIVVASDIYALGGTLFYMLTGRHAFKREKRDPMAFMNAHLREAAPDLLAFNPALPRDLGRLFQSMMAKDPAARPTATDLLEEFQRLLPGKGTSSTRADAAQTDAKAGRPKASHLAAAAREEIASADRTRSTSEETELKIQNPFARVVDRTLALFEALFIPGQQRIDYGTDVALFERVFALLRRPLLLLALVIAFAALLLCGWYF